MHTCSKHRASEQTEYLFETKVRIFKIYEITTKQNAHCLMYRLVVALVSIYTRLPNRQKGEISPEK